MWSAVILVTVVGLFSTAWGQSMDPRVNIRSTTPPSVGLRILSQISEDVLIDCHVENLPPELQVNWQRSIQDQDGRESSQLIAQDMAVQDNMKWSIEKPTTFTWRLRIKAIQVSDEGNYTCYVRLTGNNNRAEANRTVLVTDIPRILESQSSNDIGVQEGDYVPMRCNASGRPFPTILWRREGNALLPGGGVRRLGSFFEIQQATHNDRGRYICEAINEVGYARRNVQLDVTFSPKIHPDPNRVGQKAGYQRTLRCNIEANPAPEDDGMSWTRGNRRVAPDSNVHIQAVFGAHGTVIYEMTFRRVTRENYGNYSCRATTTLGTNRGYVELHETAEVQPDKRGYATGCTLVASVGTTVVALLMSAMHGL